MTGTVDGGFVAECYWAGVGPDDLRSLDERVASCASELTRTGERVRYLGSMLIVEDEVVLCLFEGSATAVRNVAERAAIPFGRTPGHRRTLVEGVIEPRRRTGEKEVFMKRIGVIALSAGLVLALGACSSSSSDSGSTSSTSAPPTSTAPAATSAAADTGDLSGTWSGQYDGTFQGTFVLDWQQSGSNLSGTIKLSSPSPGRTMLTVV